MATARDLIQPCDHILVGFEGVLCAPEFSAQAAADRLKILIGYDIPGKIAASADPFEVLRFAATCGEATAFAVERQLCRLETQAVTSAPAIPGAVRAMERLAAAGNTLTVVSRFGTDVVRSFFVLHELGSTIRRIAARAGATTPLPPDPHLMLETVKSLGTSPERCLMIAGTKAGAKAARTAELCNRTSVTQPVHVTHAIGTLVGHDDERSSVRGAIVEVMSRVLLIEDDEAVRDGLQLALTRQGHTVHAAGTGEQGLGRLPEADVVVLDLMLPGMDGFEVCRRIRAAGDLPIIMLTARDDDMDVVAGLEAGADDYVVKPVRARVLEARIRAVLRRGGASGDARQPEGDEYGALTIDREGLVVSKNGRAIGLTPTELRLLLELSSSPGRVLSRQQLLEAVWEHGYLGDSRLVDACVQRLRAKIEDDPASPLYIQTVRGFGYRFGPL